MVGRGHYQFVHAYDGIYIYILKKTNWCLLALHCAQPHKIHSQYKNYTTNSNITAHSIRLSEQVEAYCIHHILANDNSNECITTTKCTLNLKEADTANCIHTVHTRWIFNTWNFVFFFFRNSFWIGSRTSFHSLWMLIHFWASTEIILEKKISLGCYFWIKIKFWYRSLITHIYERVAVEFIVYSYNLMI